MCEIVKILKHTHRILCIESWVAVEDTNTALYFYCFFVPTIIFLCFYVVELMIPKKYMCDSNRRARVFRVAHVKEN